MDSEYLPYFVMLIGAYCLNRGISIRRAMKEYERDPDYDPDNIDMNAGCSSTINIVFGILFYIIGGIPLLMQLWKWFLNINK